MSRARFGFVLSFAILTACADGTTAYCDDPMQQSVFVYPTDSITGVNAVPGSKLVVPPGFARAASRWRSP